MLANAAISGWSSAAATSAASHSGSAVASGLSSATNSQSSSIAMPMLLAAAKPMFSSSRTSVTPGYVAVIAATDSSCSRCRRRRSAAAAASGRRSTRPLEQEALALKLTITTPTRRGGFASPHCGNHAHRLQPFTSSLRRPHEIALPTSGSRHTHLDAALRYRAVLPLLADRWHPGIRVLEVGSGSGGAAEWTDDEIVGVDTAFERTAERKRPNLIEHPGSVTAIPMPDASFDAVLCLDMLEHVPPADRPQAIAELMRVLAPGGRLLLTLPVRAGRREARPLARRAPMPPGMGSRTRGPRSISSSASPMRPRSLRSLGRRARASPSTRTSGRLPGASSTAPTPSAAACRSRGRSSTGRSSRSSTRSSPA